MHIITSDISSELNWSSAVDAIRQGHLLAEAIVRDMQLKTVKGISLNRAAAIRGLGLGVKSMTIFPENKNLQPVVPTVQGEFLLFDDDDGHVKSIIDGVLITKWKTAADSMLGVQLLARHDSKTVVVVGSGVLAASLVEAYLALANSFPGMDKILICSRNFDNALQLAKRYQSVDIAVKAEQSLEAAVRQADIVSTATTSKTPVIQGEWVAEGTHIDLIGAFNPEMREADDALLLKSKLCVDSRDTTIAEIGELMIPIANGVISADNVLADLYQLCQGLQVRTDDKDITLFKNGGGAHLDLMIANYIYQQSITNSQ
jgi:ornithine cyclodeaminase